MGTKIIFYIAIILLLGSSCKKQECNDKTLVYEYFPDTNWFCYNKFYSSYIIESSDSLKQTLYSKRTYSNGEFSSWPVYNFNPKPGDECKSYIMQSRHLTTYASVYGFTISYGLHFNSTSKEFLLYYHYIVSENNENLSESMRMNLNTDTTTYEVKSNKFKAPQNLKSIYHPIYTNRLNLKIPEVFEFRVVGSYSVNIPHSASKLFFAKKYGLIEYHQKMEFNGT